MASAAGIARRKDGRSSRGTEPPSTNAVRSVPPTPPIHRGDHSRRPGCVPREIAGDPPSSPGPAGRAPELAACVHARVERRSPSIRRATRHRIEPLLAATTTRVLYSRIPIFISIHLCCIDLGRADDRFRAAATSRMSVFSFPSSAHTFTGRAALGARPAAEFISASRPATERRQSLVGAPANAVHMGGCGVVLIVPALASALPRATGSR
ncbi:hypothetical protein WOLCODRAFT_164173 [Wolfiporia cocos MD-104 SS10]|uniref:Uncharacterized protein n=1 Tax=Wolfiporia cocos (strain MD-104) TaxID=742152 RepID=A0A2H3JVT9_WOLCO|nr:hypothetical protein WOLCODRAFT_164173 [Wolfiporia cocos MD-104 SS10]